MGRVDGSRERPLAGPLLGRKTVRRVLLAVFFACIGGLAFLYRSAYPLALGSSSGFLEGIPVAFWPLLLGALASGYLVCVSTRARWLAGALLVALSLSMNFSQYLFFTFTGGDAPGEISRWFVIRGLPRFSIDLFEYFQWPMHFLVFETVGKATALPLVEGIRFGYLLLYLLFTVATVYLFGRHLRDRTYWVAATLVYLLFMVQFLNNQLVPQLFALTVLLVLFGFGTPRDRRDRFVQLPLYTLLVLSHPFFFVFYLGFVAALPFTRSLKARLAERGGAETPVYASAGRALRRPARSLRSWLADGARRFASEPGPAFAAMVGIYAVLFLSRFSVFREEVVQLLSKPAQTSYGGSGSVLRQLLGVLFADPTASATDTRSLYYLSSELLHQATVYTLILLFVTLVAASLVLFVGKATGGVSPTQLAIGTVGTAYYVAGFALPLIGTRALQIALLPVGALMAGRPDRRRVVAVLALVAVVLSPVVAVNGIVNASIGAGGNTGNAHAHAAGLHATGYDVEPDRAVMKYPHAGLPPEFPGRELTPTVTLEDLVRGEPTRPSLVVFGPRQVHAAAAFAYDCNFVPDRRNAVYDNGVSILSDSVVSGPFECRPEN